MPTTKAPRRQAPEQELLTRLRRVETRLTNFIRYFGVDPVMDFDEAASRTVTTDGTSLFCATPCASLGDLLFTAHKHKLKGNVDVFVAGRFAGTVRAPDPLVGH